MVFIGDYRTPVESLLFSKDHQFCLCLLCNSIVISLNDDPYILQVKGHQLSMYHLDNSMPICLSDTPYQTHVLIDIKLGTGVDKHQTTVD